MMKQYFKLIVVMMMINAGCSAQKNILETNINNSGSKEPIEDSVMQKLQSENDIVIAYAIENFAWGRSIHYKIIAQKDGSWKGYVYHKSLMPPSAATPTSVVITSVQNNACDSLLNYITTNKAWEIKGDSENGFCKNGNKNCNIYDAAGSRLWLISKDAVLQPSYYAPEFYEKCCPDEQRGLFLSITQKIAAIVSEKQATE